MHLGHMSCFGISPPELKTEKVVFYNLHDTLTKPGSGEMILWSLPSL